MSIKVFFHPHLMELSVSTESELITYISLGLGLGRTRLVHLIEVAEQPRMRGGEAKAHGGLIMFDRTSCIGSMHHCVASERLLFVRIFSELDMLTELSRLV